MNRALPSVSIPAITVVLSPSGNVYETPSTVSASLPVLASISAKPSLPASIETSNESSPVKLVERSI